MILKKYKFYLKFDFFMVIMNVVSVNMNEFIFIV